VSPANVLDALAKEPWKFDFFHALRLIDAQHPKQPRLGTARKPSDESIRLGQSPDLSFAPATLHAVDQRGGRTPRIDVRFFGLFGPNGPLPLHLTEYARERQLHHGDQTFARFADLFHHRLLLLFYRAWAQAQPAVSLDRPAEDRFAAFVGSLIGIGTPTLQNRDAAGDHAKLHFAGLLSRQVRSSEGLASLLSGYLRRTVQVEQFAGAWLALQASERTRIGRTLGGRRNLTARLGAGAVLGATVWDRQHGFCIHIGPLDHATFEALLPAGKSLPAVVALVEQYVGHEFGWSLKLGLRAEQVKPARPGIHGRLGWDSWLNSPSRSGVAPLRLQPTDALRALRRRQRTDHH
jgi:type VI secretion system protein ImpH